jgi:hypothetical protein
MSPTPKPPKCEPRTVRLDRETDRRVQALQRRGVAFSQLVHVGLKLALPLAEKSPVMLKHLSIEE